MRVPIGNVNLYCEEAGAGESVILLHAHSVDRRMWDPQFERFSERYHVIRYDLRGYGRSDLPKGAEAYLHAEDLRGLMDKLNISKAHLVGLSLGSFVALDMLALYPDRVLSVSVASGAIFDGLTERPDNQDPDFKREIDVPAYKQQWLESLLTHCGTFREEISDRLLQMISDWSAWQPIYETSAPLLGASGIPLLIEADPNIPVLVVIGEADSEGSHRSSEVLLNIRPNAKAVRLQEAGHFSSMETPDSYNEAHLHFWQSMGSTTRCD